MSTGSSAYLSNRTVGCFPGYTLIGSSFRTCGADKKWSGTDAVCSSKVYSIYMYVELKGFKHMHTTWTHPPRYTNTCTHAHAHARAHTRTRTHTHTHTHAAGSLDQECPQGHTWFPSFSLLDFLSHTHVCTRPCTLVCFQNEKPLTPLSWQLQGVPVTLSPRFSVYYKVMNSGGSRIWVTGGRGILRPPKLVIT